MAKVVGQILAILFCFVVKGCCTGYNTSYSFGCYCYPDKTTITEKSQPDSQICQINATTDAKYIVDILDPPSLSSYLEPYFAIKTNNSDVVLSLVKQVDVELIYEEKNVVLTNIVMNLTCRDKYGSDSEVSITIDVTDVDDNAPQFQNTDTSSCPIPGYTANADRSFLGKLETSPGAIVATDGDVFPNNISYSVLHGEPVEYDSFFSIDAGDGAISKTTAITDSDPQNFVILVQATELSAVNRSSIAVVSVTVTKILPEDGQTTQVNATVLLLLRILSGLLIVAFTVAFAIIIRHRTRKHRVANKPVTKERKGFVNIEIVKEDSYLRENTIILQDAKIIS